VVCERRGARTSLPVQRAAEGEQVNAWLLLFVRFCSVVPFSSSMLWGCVFLHTAAARGCGDVSHLFLGWMKVFFAFFEVDSAAALAQTARAKLKYDSQDVWACVACCCCASVGQKHRLGRFLTHCSV
jgi:hypothetical protein